MMSSLVSMVGLLLVVLMMTNDMSSIHAFTSVAVIGRSINIRNTQKQGTQLFFFGGPKDDGSPGDYVCLVR
jgi:hypothetical protein